MASIVCVPSRNAYYQLDRLHVALTIIKKILGAGTVCLPLLRWKDLAALVCNIFHSLGKILFLTRILYVANNPFNLSIATNPSVFLYRDLGSVSRSLV